VKIKFLFNDRRPRGQGLVEFSLIMPLLLLVIVSIIDFGRLMFTISSVASASRDAARYGASVGTDAFGIAHYQDCCNFGEPNYRKSNWNISFHGLIRLVQSARDSSYLRK
jgi:hypothetical protein